MKHEDREGRPGRLIVLSGPSGSGKSTLVKRLLRRPGLRIQVSISATTRPPRADEVDGRDYFFMTKESFEAIRDQLLESAEVHGHLYGTPSGPVRDALARGICVLLVIDVQGGMQIRDRVPDALLVFLDVPDLGVLEQRLRSRGTDDEMTIQRRLENARHELEMKSYYDFVVINDDLDRAADELAAFLEKNHCGVAVDHD